MQKAILFGLVYLALVQADFWSVFVQTRSGKTEWYISAGKIDSAVAYAEYYDTVEETGWARLTVTTNPKFTDTQQAYGAGFLEGAITTQRIWQSYQNYLIVTFGNLTVPPKMIEWVDSNNEWMYLQISQHRADPYWQQVALVLEQMQGLTDGYNAYGNTNQQISFEEQILTNADGDLEELIPAVTGPSSDSQNDPQPFVNTHCSAIVKQSADKRDLYAGHTTWTQFGDMLRTYKTYNFSFSSSKAKAVSFSSYPAVLLSVDDYYITDQNLMVTETTNGIYNNSLFALIVPQSILSWIRTIVANRMATDGKSWTTIFAKYNSGTYNNQWMIVDYKNFVPGQNLSPNTLWIIEQMPGKCESADVTPILMSKGYWPSYNVPFFKDIFVASGFQQMVNKYGPDYSYDGAPRAKIFQRDHKQVTSLEQAKAILRYNGWQWDPLAEGNPVNAISARADLASTGAQAFGGIDSKITSYQLISRFKSQAISGPTFYQQQIFAWEPQWTSAPHLGCPARYNFDWQTY